MFQRNVWSHFNAVQMCNHTFLHKIPQLFVTLWCERQSSTRSLEETTSENMHCCLRAPTNVTCECASVPAIKPTKLAGKTRGVVSVLKKTKNLFFLFPQRAFRHLLSLSFILCQPLSLSPSCSTSHSHRQGHTEARYFLRRAETTFPLTHLHSNTHIAKLNTVKVYYICLH